VVGFCRLLRRRGLKIGPPEAADALRALAAVDLGDRHETYLALRATLASGKDALRIFDTAFWEFWGPLQPESEQPAAPGDESSLPADLTAYVRGRPGYDYQHHAESGSSNAAFVDDESVDRFCVIGEPDEHIAKLRALAAIGVTQFNVYLMSGEEESVLEAYGREIIPALKALRPVALA